jgi:predicted PurR-regulated permease PerM
LVIGIVVLTVYAGYAMQTVTVPLLIALALAYLVEPVVVRLARWRNLGRPLAVVAILGALGLALSVAVAIVVPLAVGQTLSFAQNLRSHRYDGAITRMVEVVPEQYREDARSWIDRVIYPNETRTASATEEEKTPADAQPAVMAGEEPEASGDGESKSEVAVRETSEGGVVAASAGAGAATGEPDVRDEGVLRSIAPTVRESGIGSPVLSLLGAGSRQVYAFMLGVLQLSLLAFLIPFYFYYFSVHWPAITGFFAGLIPDERKGTVLQLASEMDRAVAGFVRGRIVICILMGVMFAVGWQVCGVPYGIALGVLTGALSIVPYLGGIGLPVAVGLLAVDQFGLPPDARMALWGILLWPTAVFVVVQTIEGYLLTPVIAGKATNLDPVTIVVAILAGGSVAGVYGMLLAIPIAACGKIALTRIVMPRLLEFARGRVADPLPLEGALGEERSQS